jgi:hypothetical protein
MSSPRDRDRDGFDDAAGSGWQEPAHLGEGAGTPADRPADPPGGADPGWQPPGWELPTVEPERPAAAPPATPDAPRPPAVPGPDAGWDPPAADQRQSDVPPGAEAEGRRRGWGGLFSSRPEEPPADAAGPAFPVPVVDPGDPYGLQAWAAQLGWSSSDGTGPEDAALAELVRTAPVRPGKEDRPGHVLRGRGNGLDLVACDVLSPVGRGFVATHAITAAPLLGDVPGFRLSPARIWRHRIGGLLQIPGPDPEFDRRWVLLAAEDGPQVRALVEDPVVRQSLLGSDDGDELWAAAGFVAAVRPDAHRPLLVEHHARLLAAVVGALARGR